MRRGATWAALIVGVAAVTGAVAYLRPVSTEAASPNARAADASGETAAEPSAEPRLEEFLRRSHAARRAGDTEEALELASSAVELDEGSGAAQHAYAKALAQQMMEGNKLAALPLLPRWKRAIRRAIELDPKNIDARLEEITFYVFMPRLVGGNLEHAKELCRELEEIAPARGLLWRAIACRRADETEQAMELCERGLREYPEERMFAVTLGNMLAETGRWKEADARYEEAKGGEDEAHYRALEAQASIRIEVGFEPDNAVAMIDEYLAGVPDVPMMPPAAFMWSQRGRALEALGRLEDAREAYERALELDPGLERAEDRLSELRGR